MIATFLRNLVGGSWDRKFAVFWNASENIGALSSPENSQSTFLSPEVRRVGSVRRDYHVGWPVSEEGAYSDLGLIAELEK